MLFKLNLQLFASKKGVSSTKNGRDSESHMYALFLGLSFIRKRLCLH